MTFLNKHLMTENWYPWQILNVKLETLPMQANLVCTGTAKYSQFKCLHKSLCISFCDFDDSLVLRCFLWHIRSQKEVESSAANRSLQISVGAKMGRTYDPS